MAQQGRKEKHMNMRTPLAVGVIIAALAAVGTVDAALIDRFGGWALIDQAGNADDTGGTKHGGVGYDYHIAKHAVSIADWEAFYFDATSQKRGSFSGLYNYWENAVGKAAPVVAVSMYNAAQYANWLTTGNATEGAYTIDSTGYVTGIDRDYRNAEGMLYVIPTEDEWYKAAYFRLDDSTYYTYATPEGVTLVAGDDGDDKWNYAYALGSYVVRDVGRFGLEQNGTRNMMGNVWEWMEDTGGVIRGGESDSSAVHLSSSFRTPNNPAGIWHGLGFRVVAIPEPATFGMLGAAAAAMLLRRRFRG
jgi:formylglycine-generating enzyme